MLEDLENEVKMNYERYRSMKASPLTFGQLFQFEHFKTKKYRSGRFFLHDLEYLLRLLVSEVSPYRLGVLLRFAFISCFFLFFL